MRNVKGKYRCIVRSTSNHISTTDQYQVSLPPHVWKRMKWKLNEPVVVTCNKETQTLEIRRDDGTTKEI